MGLQTTEQELQSKADHLESMAKQTLDRDKQMRKLAPPVDWEAIAVEGADKFAAEWDAMEGVHGNRHRCVCATA